MFFFFSNGIGLAGSLLMSIILSALLLYACSDTALEVGACQKLKGSVRPIFALVSSAVPALPVMEPDDRELERWPKCPQCGAVMRLVGIEDGEQPRTRLHTYECECGEREAYAATQM
jgi:predicted RNA-binding Zn-ribbon protein involved in translation (DUF1610 family)